MWFRRGTGGRCNRRVSFGVGFRGIDDHPRGGHSHPRSDLEPLGLPWRRLGDEALAAQRLAFDPPGRTASTHADHADGKSLGAFGAIEKGVERAEQYFGRTVDDFGRNPGRETVASSHAAGDPARQAVGLTQELEHERRCRLSVQLVRGSHLFQAASVHHRDAISQSHGFFLVVGDEDGGHARGVVDAPQLIAKLGAHLAVERSERLVQEEQARLDRQGPGHRGALALAARELVRKALAEPLDARQGEEFGDPRGDRLARRALARRAHVEAKGDVPGHAHVAKQGVVLEHQADATFARADRQEVQAVEEDAAVIGPVQPGEHPQQGGLTRSGRPQEGQEFALPHVEGNAGQGREAAELLVDAIDRQGHGITPSPAVARRPRRSRRDLAARVTRASPASREAAAKAPTKS